MKKLQLLPGIELHPQSWESTTLTTAPIPLTRMQFKNNRLSELVLVNVLIKFYRPVKANMDIYMYITRVTYLSSVRVVLLLSISLWLVDRATGGLQVETTVVTSLGLSVLGCWSHSAGILDDSFTSLIVAKETVDLDCDLLSLVPTGDVKELKK